MFCKFWFVVFLLWRVVVVVVGGGGGGSGRGQFDSHE